MRDLQSSPRIVDRLRRDPRAEREALIAGLLAAEAAIAFKYFYDALGCALFAAICELDEYYPTRTEARIFARYREEIAARAGRGAQLIDLGAGDGRKAQAWLDALRPRRYVAVDIAREALDATLARLARERPDVDGGGIQTDFAAGLDIAAELERHAALFFYPGSSIGNFAPDEAVEFLAAIRRHFEWTGPGSALLIGVDTKKDRATLEAAYDDAVGVTAAFNRNILRHVNALIGSDFDPRAFAHRALYDAEAGRIEMYLEAECEQVVRIAGRVRTFARGERIATEHSYKYAVAEFEALLRRAGFSKAQCWQDDAGAFAVFLAT